MLLAEANQWPTDVIPYFGLGDEFTWRFTFPDATDVHGGEAGGPQSDLTPGSDTGIPEICQWWHLSAHHERANAGDVTEIERDYMYDNYAADKAMRYQRGHSAAAGSHDGNDGGG